VFTRSKVGMGVSGSGDAGRDLTALSGAPPAVGNVSGGYNPGDNTQHVIFRSNDGRLHELWHVVGDTAVHHIDLTAA
jgi:hypothetical protein